MEPVFVVIPDGYVHAPVCTSLLGMCMCVAVHCDKVSGVVYVFGGFEDGSIVLWDTRHCQSEVTSIKLFTEPGEE